MQYVEKKAKDECWLWTGSVTQRGYGQFKFHPTKTVSAHRAAFMLLVGEIPKAAHVCHKCDVPLCCNPFHLFLGNQKINHADKKQKGRAKNQHSRNDMSVCLRGHTDGWRVSKGGYRYCTNCQKERNLNRKI
jgi:hypothetical protein